MVGAYWYDLVLLIFSLGLGVVLIQIFLIALFQNYTRNNFLFLIYSFLLFLTTMFTLMVGFPGSKTVWGNSIPLEISQVVFWIANASMSITFFSFSTDLLDIPRSVSLKSIAFLISLGLVISSFGIVFQSHPFSLLQLISGMAISISLLTKIFTTWNYLRAGEVRYKFFIALSGIQFFGLDLAFLFSLSFILITLTTIVVYLGALYTSFWDGLFKPLLTRNKELSGEIQKGLIANQKIDQLNQELVEAYESTLEGWARTLELRDKETEGHSRRVTALASKLAAAMDLSDEDQMNLRFGALLHDIGKMAISNEILRKPGPLNQEERKIIEQHPTYAFNLLRDINFLENAIVIPTHHHEKWDGTGYPGSLQAEGIPMLARMFCIVDVWDALTTDRPYSKAWTPQRAKEYILEEAGKHFDPEIVEVFFKKVISI